MRQCIKIINSQYIMYNVEKCKKYEIKNISTPANVEPARGACKFI